VGGNLLVEVVGGLVAAREVVTARRSGGCGEWEFDQTAAARVRAARPPTAVQEVHRLIDIGSRLGLTESTFRAVIREGPANGRKCIEIWTGAEWSSDRHFAHFREAKQTLASWRIHATSVSAQGGSQPFGESLTCRLGSPPFTESARVSFPS
jgi:hypothetical protein